LQGNVRKVDKIVIKNKESHIYSLRSIILKHFSFQVNRDLVDNVIKGVFSIDFNQNGVIFA